MKDSSQLHAPGVLSLDDPTEFVPLKSESVCTQVWIWTL